MNMLHPRATNVLVAGAGIGGLATTLALAQRGLSVDLIEQSPHIGEIGAGLQLGPNAFAALDALGVGEAVRKTAVFTERLVMMDAVDCSEVASVPVGEAFRTRFGNPYAVTHRADLHTALFDAVRENPLVRVHTGARIANVTFDERTAHVETDSNRVFQGAALIGCDGVKSVVRSVIVGDEHRVSGHVVYRAVVPLEQMPEDLRMNAPVVWAGPHCHLVHYPLRGGREYNLVVTFHSRDKEVWGVSDGSKEEVLSYFEGVHPRARQLLNCPTSWRRWSTADRDPVDTWSKGCATVLGDAAHPMMQYLAQGACMALEDAVTLGAAIDETDFDFPAALCLYERARVARAARVVLSVREMGRIYHAAGVERLVRNALWTGRKQERFYDAMEWLYGWQPAHCLDDASNLIRPAEVVA
ncbi:3-hydroxybenzoate 6-monooxygenase [Paraburkholderia madseniana]|uniref:3-hydroxybenzoate 6-monooxygenase n=1 Tax=Paraburkholderia madseniana TaxID=2599607 RepID=UPI0038BCDB48